MAEQLQKDTAAMLPGPRDPAEVPPEKDTDAEHKGHDSWLLLGVYTPEQDYELDAQHKAVQRGAVEAPVAKYICQAKLDDGTLCGVVKEEPWKG
jgi:hypothetical protein